MNLNLYLYNILLVTYFSEIFFNIFKFYLLEKLKFLVLLCTVDFYFLIMQMLRKVCYRYFFITYNNFKFVISLKTRKIDKITSNYLIKWCTFFFSSNKKYLLTTVIILKVAHFACLFHILKIKYKFTRNLMIKIIYFISIILYSFNFMNLYLFS